MANHENISDNADLEDKTISCCLFWFNNPALRKELESFRIKYELQFGETDLAKRYTSVWPSRQQELLLEKYPKQYFEGLPPFVKAFVKEKMHTAKRNGRLDDMPDSFLSLYLSGKMDLGNDGYLR